MRMIDADALIAQMEADAEQIDEPIAQMFVYAAINDIKHAPTIEERKTGKWIKKDCDLLYCSECDLPSLHPWPYCERCGAKMGEKSD